MSAAARRGGRWQPPAAPSPRILHLPRRSRVSVPRPARAAAPPPPLPPRPAPMSSPPRQNLKSLLDMERSAVCRSSFDRRSSRSGRERVAEGAAGTGEERWRVEAEILRAECNFLRMEREVAMRKLAKNRERMEASLRSALGTLMSGRRKVDGSGEGSLDEIAELLKKLDEMRIGKKTGRRRKDWGKCVDDSKKAYVRNFDRQASVLRRKLEKEMAADAGEEAAAAAASVKEIGVIISDKDVVTVPANPGRFPDVEMMRKKMEGLSRGLVERMEEYGLLLSAAAASPRSSDMITGTRRSSSNSKKSSEGRAHQKKQEGGEVGNVGGRKETACCNCKEVVGWIVEQVRAESEQWNEMQLMLDQLRAEMQELQSSRDRWHQRAAASDLSLHTLQTEILGWRRRAVESEDKVTELQEKIERLNRELHSSRDEKLCSRSSGLAPATEDIWIPQPPANHGSRSTRRSVESTGENEKHVLVCRLKKQVNCSKRLPLQEIGNSSVF